MSKNSSKPRLREIVEGALGNIIAAVILAIVGIAGGITTIGWFPTLAILLAIIGISYVWYIYDPAFQRLISQRLFKLRHAISSESVVIPRWNLIANETILEIARQNNLRREHLNVEHRRNINFNGREYLEIVISHKIGGNKWLGVVDNNGNMVDLYGNIRALTNECNNCGSTVLVRYWKLKSGEVKIEPQTTCRRCKNIMNFTYISFEEDSQTPPKVKEIKKPIVEVKDGAVMATIEFVVQNYGAQKEICPTIQLLVAVLERGQFVEKFETAKLKKIILPSNAPQSISYKWRLPLATIILSDKPDGIKITIPQC